MNNANLPSVYAGCYDVADFDESDICARRSSPSKADFSLVFSQLAANDEANSPVFTQLVTDFTLPCTRVDTGLPGAKRSCETVCEPANMVLGSAGDRAQRSRLSIQFRRFWQFWQLWQFPLIRNSRLHLISLWGR